MTTWPWPFLTYAALMRLAASDEIIAALLRDRIEDLDRRLGIGPISSVRTP